MDSVMVLGQGAVAFSDNPSAGHELPLPRAVLNVSGHAYILCQSITDVKAQ